MSPPFAASASDSLAPSPWVVKHASCVPAGGRVLDLACGSGRHSRFFVARGHPVDAVDRDLGGFSEPPVGARLLHADLEADPWPLAGQRYAGVIVTNYLHRALFPALLAAVDAGGVLIYETFARGNEFYGRPSRPEFLLAPDELLQVVAGHLQVLDFAQGVVDTPRNAVTQRIVAIRAPLGAHAAAIG